MLPFDLSYRSKSYCFLLTKLSTEEASGRVTKLGIGGYIFNSKASLQINLRPLSYVLASQLLT